MHTVGGRKAWGSFAWLAWIGNLVTGGIRHINNQQDEVKPRLEVGKERVVFARGSCVGPAGGFSLWI